MRNWGMIWHLFSISESGMLIACLLTCYCSLVLLVYLNNLRAVPPSHPNLGQVLRYCNAIHQPPIHYSCLAKPHTSAHPTCHELYLSTTISHNELLFHTILVYV